MLIHNPKCGFRTFYGGSGEITFAINRILRPTSTSRLAAAWRTTVTNQIGVDNYAVINASAGHGFWRHDQTSSLKTIPV
jgi:hypothetical protein